MYTDNLAAANSASSVNSTSNIANAKYASSFTASNIYFLPTIAYLEPSDHPYEGEG